jgi:serine protease inhibitor
MTATLGVLVQVLQALGMKTAFSGLADFKRISATQLRVSDVLQSVRAHGRRHMGPQWIVVPF